MIRELHLENFKGWSDTGRLEFAPITGLFGSNSSGKTSILQALLLLKQTTDSSDRARVFDLGGDRSPVALGTFLDVLFKHNDESELSIGLQWDHDDVFVVSDPESQEKVVEDDRLAYAVRVSVDRQEPVVNELKFEVGGAGFSMRRKASKRHAYTLSTSNCPGFRFTRVPGRRWDLPTPIKCYGFPDQVRAYYRNAGFLSDLELAFENLFGRIYYLGPLRDDPHRQYTWSGGRPQDVGIRGENAIEALIASRSDRPTNSRGFVHRRDGLRRLKRIGVEEHVAAWLEQLGLISSFNVEPVDVQETLFRVSVRRTPESAEVLLPDIGFGVSQVLPVLVLLAYVPEGSTVVLEQPEIHLHPAVQAELADVLIEAALARRLQIVVESHSEHLLLRLQRRIAERELARGITVEPEDVSLYFCDVKDGSATAERLEMDLFGNICNWPRNFFGNAFEESSLMAEAALSRAESSRG